MFFVCALDVNWLYDVLGLFTFSECKILFYYGKYLLWIQFKIISVTHKQISFMFYLFLLPSEVWWLGFRIFLSLFHITVHFLTYQ